MNGRIVRTTPERAKDNYIGRIKVGMKSEKGYPRSVDYFVPSGRYSGLFLKAYGEKPQTIKIVFMSDDPNEVCREEYEYRDDSGKLIATGDGVEFRVWDGKDYRDCEGENIMNGVIKRYPSKKGWSVTLTLNFFVPEVRGVWGLWQFKTKGQASTIPNIRSAFDSMLEQRGSVKGVIWDMNVKFATTQKPGDTSRYPVVTITPNESEESLQRIKEATKPIKLLEQI